MISKGAREVQYLKGIYCIHKYNLEIYALISFCRDTFYSYILSVDDFSFPASNVYR